MVEQSERGGEWEGQMIQAYTASRGLDLLQVRWVGTGGLPPERHKLTCIFRRSGKQTEGDRGQTRPMLLK